MTAGMGSGGTRGGGSGTSSGTVIDDRAGFDAQDAISNPAMMATCVAVFIFDYTAEFQS